MSGPKNSIFFDRLETPVGDLVMAAGIDGLRRVTFIDCTREKTVDNWLYSPAEMQPYTRQMKEYLAGERKVFSLALDPQGTPFQCTVWQRLREIPFGTTITYGELAARAGKPGAARAVGNANGKNPIVIIQPCHRVVAAGDKLGGFSAGIFRKRYLLGLEKGVQPLF